MTHFKQMALLVASFFIVMLITVLALTFEYANNSVQNRLYEDAQNTASSLSLSLGSAQGDLTMMSTMINANFDSGNYAKIALIDVDGKVLYEQVKEDKELAVPQWFVGFFPIEAPSVSANVLAGWSQVGTLHVQSDIAYAYESLYDVFTKLLLSFGILVLVGLIILYVVLLWMLKPLKRVQRQAEAVQRNEFILQEQIPSTKEFKDVVLAMNSMVTKAKALFEKGNKELKRLSELEFTDSLTGLKNRKYLIDKLPEFLKVDAASTGGVNMLLAFNGVIEANEKLGHRAVDDLFCQLGEKFKENTKEFKDAIVARMNGTEFMVFLPECSKQQGEEIAQHIVHQCSELLEEKGLDTDISFVSVGLCEYSSNQTISQLFSCSDNALAQAKFSTTKIYAQELRKSSELMGKELWREVILEAIEQQNFSFAPYKVLNFKNGGMHHYALSITLHVTSKTSYSYGQFMAVANQLRLADAIYTTVLQILFKKLQQQFAKQKCSLRLPYEYLNSMQHFNEIKVLCENYAKTLSMDLIIEIPDKFAHENSEIIHLYKDLFTKHKIGMGIFEFIAEADDFGYLRELRPAYIQAHVAYLLQQPESAFGALQMMTQTIGIDTIASGVNDEQTLESLKQREIYWVQGRITETL